MRNMAIMANQTAAGMWLPPVDSFVCRFDNYHCQDAIYHCQTQLSRGNGKKVVFMVYYIKTEGKAGGPK